MTVIGIGSNLLVRDGGIPGVVIRLGRGFAAIEVEHDEIRAGAAALDRIVALAAADAGLGGLEFLSGIPGSIGGSLRMNAGAYGREMKDVLVSAIALDRTGETHTVEGRAMGLSYRHTDIDPSWVFVEARLRGASRRSRCDWPPAERDPRRAGSHPAGACPDRRIDLQEPAR